MSLHFICEVIQMVAIIIEDDWVCIQFVPLPSFLAYEEGTNGSLMDSASSSELDP